MSHDYMTVGAYLKELRRNKRDKPAEIKEALETYIRLWEEVIRKCAVRPEGRSERR